MDFDAEGKYVVTTASDKHVVVWHNTAGRHESVYHLEKDLINASAGALKDRIQKQLDEARDNSVLSPSPSLPLPSPECARGHTLMDCFAALFKQ